MEKGRDRGEREKGRDRGAREKGRDRGVREKGRGLTYLQPVNPSFILFRRGGIEM